MKREVDHELTFYCALDNYSVTRDYRGGKLKVYAADETRAETMELYTLMTPFGHKDLYLIDDGKIIRPFYVSGWTQDEETFYLQPFPTNPDGRTRPDNGRVIDFTSWYLGPRRAWHMKVSAS